MHLQIKFLITKKKQIKHLSAHQMINNHNDQIYEKLFIIVIPSRYNERVLYPIKSKRTVSKDNAPENWG